MGMGRWLKLLPDGSQLLVLAGILAAVFATISFTGLALTKSAAVARYEAAKARYEQTMDQQQRLEYELVQAQRETNIRLQAYRFFRLLPPGVVVVEPEESSDSGTQWVSGGSQPPYWAEWIKLLSQP